MSKEKKKKIDRGWGGEGSRLEQEYSGSFLL